MARPRAPWRHFRSRSRTASSWWRSRSPRALASFQPDAAHGAHDPTGEILTSKLNKPDQTFRPTIERGRKPHDRYQDTLAKPRCGSASRGRHIRGLGTDAADHRAALSDADPGADAGGAAELHPSHGRAAEETGRRKLVPFPPNL